MKNKYHFLSGDYVVEFESPLPLEPTFKWFSKNCFDKRHISYEFALCTLPKPEHSPIELTFQTFSSIEDVIHGAPKNANIKAVALHDAPANDIYGFINVIKSMYKIRKQYWVF